MVNFVLHPLTRIFMQEYREGVGKKGLNAQNPPIVRCGRCEVGAEIFTALREERKDAGRMGAEVKYIQ